MMHVIRCAFPNHRCRCSLPRLLLLLRVLLPHLDSRLLGAARASKCNPRLEHKLEHPDRNPDGPSFNGS
jgi:hypothetical protein